MWWLSQAELKDALNRWICSSFQPMSAQNIPHLDPRGSWKHFCGTPGELNCPSLMYRMSCKRYSTKIRSLGEAPWFGERNARTQWSSHKPLLVSIAGVSGLVCSGGQCVCCAAKAHLVSSLLLSSIFARKKRFSPNCLRELTENCKFEGEGEGVRMEQTLFLPNHGQNKGEKAKPRDVHVGLCSGVTNTRKTWNVYGNARTDL